MFMFNGQVFSHGESCRLPLRPATQRCSRDVLLVFVPERFQRRQHRVRRGLAETAEAGVADDIAQVFELVEVGQLPRTPRYPRPCSSAAACLLRASPPMKDGKLDPAVWSEEKWQHRLVTSINLDTAKILEEPTEILGRHPLPA